MGNIFLTSFNIGTAVNITLLATFIFSILMGFLRSYKRSFNKLLANIVIILLSFFLSGLVAKTLANFDLSIITGSNESLTLSDTIVDTILSDYDYDVTNIKQTIELSEAIAIGVLRLPSYMILLLIGCLILKPLLRLLFKAVIPFPTSKSFKLRLVGVGISLVSYVLITFFITAPFFGILGMINQISGVIENKHHEESNEIFEYLDDFNNGIVLGTVSSIFSDEYTLQAKFTSRLMAIETKHGSIRIKNELDSHQKLASIIFQSMNSKDENEDLDSNNKLTQTIFDNYEEIIEGFRSSDLLNVIMPSVVEILRFEFEDDVTNYDLLLNADWTQEKQNLLELITVIFEFANEVNLDFDNPKEILGHSSLPTSLKNVGISLNKSSVFKDVILVYLNDILVEAIKNSSEEFETLAEVIDLTKLDLENDFYKIGLILNDVYKISFSSEEFKVLENVTLIESLISNIFSLGTIKGNEETVVKFIINLSKINTTLEKTGVSINYNNVNWNHEVDIFKEVIVDILNLINEAGYTEIGEVDFAKLIVDSNYKESSVEILEHLADSDLFADSLVMIIVNVMDALELNEWESEKLIEYKVQPRTYAEWAKDEILKTMDLYDQLEGFADISLDTMSDSELDDLESTLLKINELEYMSLDYMLTYIDTALIESGIEVQVMDRVYDRNNSSSFDANKDEWTLEIPKLIDIISAINNTTFDANSIKDNSENVAVVLELMKSSVIFGNDLRGDENASNDDNIFNHIIINIFEKNGLIKNEYNNGFISYDEAINDDWTTYNYHNELNYLSNFDSSFSIQPDHLLNILLHSEIFDKYYD